MILTDEEWSRLLSAHAGGQIARYWCCETCEDEDIEINQCSYWTAIGREINHAVDPLFDFLYDLSMTPEQIIELVSRIKD